MLRSLRDLEEKLKEDFARLQKDPLLIVGSGLSAADAILLAQKYHIRVIHVVRRHVNDPELIFNKLPKKIYPEYSRIYEQMLHNKYNNNNSNNANTVSSHQDEDNHFNSMNSVAFTPPHPHSSSSNTENQSPDAKYVLYDEHQVKYFTSKRTCVIAHVQSDHKQAKKTMSQKTFDTVNRQHHLHKQYHQYHHRQLNELDELNETTPTHSSGAANNKHASDEIELKISYACILIGFTPDLDFLPATVVNNLAENPDKLLDLKDNPVSVNAYTHEASRFRNLFAMGPLISDNFVRFATGGALAITSAIWKYKKSEKQQDSTKAIEK